jgi:hypothetical protein
MTKKSAVIDKHQPYEILCKPTEEKGSDGDADSEGDINSGESSDSYDGDDRQRLTSSDDDDKRGR